MEDDLEFASAFPAATREQWLKLVDGVLKGAPFEKNLVSQTYDGLQIQPLYTRASDAAMIPARAPGGDTVNLPPDLTQEDHFEGLPLGTRGGKALRYTFPVDAEYEVQIRLARDLIDKGFLKLPAMFQLCLGISWTAPATTDAMLLMRNMLPKDTVWAAFGISRHEFAMAAQAVILGGHVRVGLEDNLYLEQGKLSPGNAPLVQRATEIISAIGERPATVKEARAILGLAH